MRASFDYLLRNPAAASGNIHCGAFYFGTSGNRYGQPGMAPLCLFARAWMQDWAKAFYHSAAWRAVRGYALYRDQMLCQDCLKKGLYTPAREVHHIIELTPENITDPEIALNPDNLISLCRKCHYERHNTESKKRYTIDEATGKVTPK